MSGMMPFIINSMLGGMFNGEDNNNISNMSFNQGSNNIINMLNEMLGNQGNNNNINGMWSNQSNDSIMNMLNNIVGSQVNNTNALIGNNQRTNTKNNKRNKNNKHSKNSERNDFANSFNELFNQTFTAVINNQDIIQNIVGTVLNSDLVEGMIEEIEKIDSINIEIKENEDRYLIEGKLPGVSKKDIDLDYEEDLLTIKVKNNQLFTNGKNRIVAIIKPDSDIEKKFIVKDVDINRICAVFKSDRLSVYLPKRKKQLEVESIIDVDNYIEE